MRSRDYHDQDTRLFRFVILAILILIFIGVATLKIWELRIAAERIGVMHNLGALRSALGIRLSEIVLKEGVPALAQLHLSNPIALLQGEGDEAPYNLMAGIAPQNYLGEFTSDEAPQQSGVWYFDLDQKILIYRVIFTDHFISSNEEQPDTVRYQLQVRYHDSNGNGRFDPLSETATGVSIEPQDHYTWLLDETVQHNNNDHSPEGDS